MYTRIKNKQERIEREKQKKCKGHEAMPGVMYRKCIHCGALFPVPDAEWIKYRGITGRGDSPIETT
jgi:hypothetical protein